MEGCGLVSNGKYLDVGVLYLLVSWGGERLLVFDGEGKEEKDALLL